MRVRIVVEADIEVDQLSPDLPARYPPEALRRAAQEAVTNALHDAEAEGFQHRLEDETALVIAAVQLLPD